MATSKALTPATELARKSKIRFPNESEEYRRARDVLLAEEIELRRHIERVAAQRRQLPQGGEVTRDYRFEGEQGPVTLADLFGDKQTPIDRLVAAKQARGWTKLKVYSDNDGDFTRDYVSAEDADVPAYNVFARKDGAIRQFWSGEMGSEMADPGQDPRGAPDLDPLWTILDTTPEGRGADWYPKLEYGKGK